MRLSRIKFIFDLLFGFIILLIAGIVCLSINKAWPIYAALIFQPFIFFYCAIGVFLEGSINQKFINKHKRLMFFSFFSILRQLLILMPLLIICLMYAPVISPIIFVIVFTIVFLFLNIIIPFVFTPKN